MSKAVIIVGATGTGKSNTVKELVKTVKNKSALFIYDINNEYSEYFPFPLLEVDEFMEKTQFISKGVFVFEEATIYLDNRSSNFYLKKLLVRKRHTQNTIILVFHSMRSIPRYIYELCNYIYIFKTNDSPDMTSRELKDERIKDIMERVLNNEDPKYFHTLPDGTQASHYHEILKIR